MRILLDTRPPSGLAPARVARTGAAEAFWSLSGIRSSSAPSTSGRLRSRALDRPDFDVEPDVARDAAIATGFAELPISGMHAAAVRTWTIITGTLDRMLIAQAKTEPMRLISDDPMIALHPVERICYVAGAQVSLFAHCSETCRPSPRFGNPVAWRKKARPGPTTWTLRPLVDTCGRTRPKPSASRSKCHDRI